MMGDETLLRSEEDARDDCIVDADVKGLLEATKRET